MKNQTTPKNSKQGRVTTSFPSSVAKEKRKKKFKLDCEEDEESFVIYTNDATIIFNKKSYLRK